MTYHDPCHIGRHGGIYEAPREILSAIPGAELVEMEHNRENGLCCGSVLSRVGRPPAADSIGTIRIKEAEATGLTPSSPPARAVKSSSASRREQGILRCESSISPM